MFRKTWLLSFTVLVAALASTGCAFGRNDTVPASVSGVNYTDQDIRYRLFDPADPKQKVVASEEIGPFAAGGVICCYDVPKTWKSGTKVGVILQSYDNNAGDYRPRQTFIVDLPPYDEGGKAGDVWFIAYPDGTVGVVSTAYRPNGEGWPGKIKGWPKPSIAFQRELWERDMRLAQEGIASTRKLLRKLEVDPERYLKEQWAFYLEEAKQKRSADELKKFSGPNDPALADHERKQLMEIERREQEKIDQLLKAKP
jgi:hypothetical protein